MELNPYASFLGAQDPVAVITGTPGRVASLLQPLSPARLEAARAPGKWSAREIVAHLADCELVFAFRIRQTLSMNHPIIQPFDQGAWAERYAAYDFASAMAVFRATRMWNVHLLAGVHHADWARPTTHPERGIMTLLTIVATMGGHDLNHIGQLEEIARS